jgi:hypothetical protein
MHKFRFFSRTLHGCDGHLAVSFPVCLLQLLKLSCCPTRSLSQHHSIVDRRPIMSGSSIGAFTLVTSFVKSVINMSTQQNSEFENDAKLELWPEWNRDKSTLKIYMREPVWLPNKHIYLGKLSANADKQGMEKSVRDHLQKAEVVLVGELETLEEQIRNCVTKAMMLVDEEKEFKASKKRALTTTYGTFSLERTGRISEILRYPIR